MENLITKQKKIKDLKLDYKGMIDTMFLLHRHMRIQI